MVRDRDNVSLVGEMCMSQKGVSNPQFPTRYHIRDIKKPSYQTICKRLRMEKNAFNIKVASPNLNQI